MGTNCSHARSGSSGMRSQFMDALACVAAIAAIATAAPVPAKEAPKTGVKREHWSCPYGETLPAAPRDDRLVAIPVALHALPNGGAAMTGQLVVRVPCLESRYEKHVPVAFTVEHGALRLCTDLYGLPAVPGEVATGYSIDAASVLRMSTAGARAAPAATASRCSSAPRASI